MQSPKSIEMSEVCCTKGQKIVGVVLCRNEWGLIAVSISYALLNHVDEVYVLDHSSDDETRNVLCRLKNIWGERLKVFEIRDVAFDQEAMTNTLIHFAKSSDPDWIYVFDADEFLLVDSGYSLKSVVQGATPDQIAISYSVDNFISTEDFDEYSLADYRKLRYKSVPARPYSAASASEEIYAGRSTFFDYPFPPKVVFRRSDLIRLQAGSHQVYYFGNSAKVGPDKRVRCAHLTFPTMKRLATKARMGEEFAKKGFPAFHGWQAQLIYKLEKEGRLDWFWGRHSIPKNAEGKLQPPAHVIDHDFVEALDSTLAFLEDVFGSLNIPKFENGPMPDSPAAESMIPMHQVVQLCHTLLNQMDPLIRIVDSLQSKKAK